MAVLLPVAFTPTGGGAGAEMKNVFADINNAVGNINTASIKSMLASIKSKLTSIRSMLTSTNLLLAVADTQLAVADINRAKIIPMLASTDFLYVSTDMVNRALKDNLFGRGCNRIQVCVE